MTFKSKHGCLRSTSSGEGSMGFAGLDALTSTSNPMMFYGELEARFTIMETNKSMDVDLATKDQEDKNKNTKNLEATEANRLPVEIKDSQNSNNNTGERSSEFNMEAAMIAEDVTTAGGFEARDRYRLFFAICY